VLPLSLSLLLLLLVSLVGGVALGAAGVGWAEVPRFLWAGLTGGTVRASDAAAYTIVWEIRLPRVLIGATVGAGLAAVGVAVQALVRNASSASPRARRWAPTP
jgi:iron complex transport system permease protein